MKYSANQELNLIQALVLLYDFHYDAAPYQTHVATARAIQARVNVMSKDALRTFNEANALWRD